jgi:hypothetical protein
MRESGKAQRSKLKAQRERVKAGLSTAIGRRRKVNGIVL